MLQPMGLKRAGHDLGTEQCSGVMANAKSLALQGKRALIVSIR